MSSENENTIVSDSFEEEKNQMDDEEIDQLPEFKIDSVK
jgi:hypothetical protein